MSYVRILAFSTYPCQAWQWTCTTNSTGRRFCTSDDGHEMATVHTAGDVNSDGRRAEAWLPSLHPHSPGARPPVPNPYRCLQYHHSPPTNQRQYSKVPELINHMKTKKRETRIWKGGNEKSHTDWLGPPWPLWSASPLLCAPAPLHDSVRVASRGLRAEQQHEC
jgi:hypothetical protein